MLKKPREQINGGESEIKLRLMNWKIDSEHIYRLEVSKAHKIQNAHMKIRNSRRMKCTEQWIEQEYARKSI